MKKALLTVAIVLPFFWIQPKASVKEKIQQQHTVTAWSLPEDLLHCITKTAVYQTVQGWVQKLWPF